MSNLKICTVAVALVIGIGAASAATVQNSRGTFIQDRHGAWHQYVRISQRRNLADLYRGADDGNWRQYYGAPQIQRSIGFNGADEYDYPAERYVVAQENRFAKGFHANQGYTYPTAYVFGGQSYQQPGILSER
jgi:hypothetical protein